MSDVSDLILPWYQEHARVLPWRGLSDPYAIWVSEVMLQQTKVDTVIPYFEKWMKLFPSIEELGRASEQMVLSAWEGLGYYGRVRNFHKAAKVVIDEYHGKMPTDFNNLIKLPGVGKYTAAAIASIAYHNDIGAVDGNIRRVLARVFDISFPIEKPETQRLIWKIAQENVPGGKAGEYNQALMDLGAVICTPKKPKCDQCPLETICRSVNNPESRPFLKPKQKVPHKTKCAAVIIRMNQVLLYLRPSKGLLGGMWEFPAVEMIESEIQDSVKFAAKMFQDYQAAIIPGKTILDVRHAYTHFTLNETVLNCALINEDETGILEWININDLLEKPMGKVDRKISEHIQSNKKSLSLD